MKMSGLGFVQMGIIIIIILLLYVKVLVIHHKVMTISYWYILIYLLVDASGYFDVFDGYPKLPLIPYEFRCYTIVDSLWKCRRNIISCSSGIYRYAGVTCQGKYTTPLNSVVISVPYL